MQGIQGNNRHHGIGRYTRSLVKAIIRNRGNHEIFLALNGLFPDTIEPIRAEFNELLSQDNIHVWQAPGPVNSLNSENDWRRNTAELVREAFLASLKPDIILESSLFEGPDNDTVTSVGIFNKLIPTAVILYDLIPLIYPESYLKNSIVETWYKTKLNHLRRADLLLAISESSRKEGIHHLDFSTEKCVNISASADPQFTPAQIDNKCKILIRESYDIRKDFVLYTGGVDYRKNIEGLIHSYSKLSKLLRDSHQLVIVCPNLTVSSRSIFEKLAEKDGLKKDEMVLIGFITEEELLAFYRSCKVFVFPSFHEGFGLPVLEAMSCGKAVIGSNNSSVPEVIGREDALFDPRNTVSITEKITQVLTNNSFRLELEKHSLEYAKRFSWDISAQRAINAFETLHKEKTNYKLTNSMPARRFKLAYISPLPPVRSGISDYSAELLPELFRHYDIDVIVDQELVSDPWINANCSIRSVDWFQANVNHYDRVLYHFGNNYFHQYMFNLLEKIPGVVVLHDFFLSGVVGHMHFSGRESDSWIKGLYQNHGYVALQQHFDASNTAEVPWRFPCNLTVLQNALGVVVHSENSRQLAKKWYGNNVANDWAVIPLMRVSVGTIDRALARHTLNFKDDDFIVCSFGLLGPTKLNHRLLNAWLASTLAKKSNCILVFVGENHGGEYGAEIITTIRKSGLNKNIIITGWVDTVTFRNFLAAADVGVQLRTLSRGETSATVLDCMNYGLPTIVNANGSMADLQDDCVIKLPDEFNDIELVSALETLWKDVDKRQHLGIKAKEIILSSHDPRICADQYVYAIETMYKTAGINVPALTNALACVENLPIEPQPLISLAETIALSIPQNPNVSQLFVDISELVQRDSKSGIQRVVKGILTELLNHQLEGYRVEPVYATTDHGYKYARHFTLRFLGCPDSNLIDEPIEFRSGDFFLGLDLQQQIVTAHSNFYKQLRNYGVKVKFVIYDLLPLLLPHTFHDGAAELHRGWLNVVSENDGAICISQAVSQELIEWISINKSLKSRRPFSIDWFHLGADIKLSAASPKMPNIIKDVLSILSTCPSFLMVGTLEPRKGHVQVLSAFNKIWDEGGKVNLIIVGKNGWMTESLVDNINNHPQLDKHLFWLNGISDEYLEKIYSISTCLIVASEGEGFGLPLIEAAQHKLPIIARDIPVFREVAGEHAFYFSGVSSDVLVQTVKKWLKLYTKDKHPKSNNIHWLTWQESTKQLISKLKL